MHCGVAMFLTEHAVRPGALARAVEERGFESLWFTEHSHIPASRQTPSLGGALLPQEYYGLLDSFVSLAFAAEATTRLRVPTEPGAREPLCCGRDLADRLADLKDRAESP